MRRETSARMNGVLREACESLRSLLRRATRDDVTARYQAGVIIADVKRSKDKYGTQAVLQLAKALNQDEQTLYRYATVAEGWTSAELEALLKRTTPHGQPLSWSHLVQLAGVESASERAALIDCCLRDSLSVRQLAQLVEASADGRRYGGLARIVDRFVQKADRYAHEMGTAYEELCAELEGASSRQVDLPSLLERAIASQQRLSSTAQRQVERLRAQRSQFPDPANSLPAE